MKNKLVEKMDATVEFVKNLLAFATGRTITFQEYIDLECKEIFGDENRWYTGQNLRRAPTHMDCQKNYINHKADKLFHRKHHYLVERPWQKKTKEFLSSKRDRFTSQRRQANYNKWREGQEVNFSE